MKTLRTTVASGEMVFLRQNKAEFESSPGNFLLKTKAHVSPPSPDPSFPLHLHGIQELTNLLLPRNYETSTLPTHLTYVKHSMLSSVFGCAASVVSMQALLLSMGVGGGGPSSSSSSSSSGSVSTVLPIAATVNWILKDGLGQFGGIFFANRVNTSFDADPKRFRLAADGALACGVVLESCTALFPSLFLPIASVANVSKNVAWISASATRASIHQSFCLDRNLADVTAKAGSQSTCASVLGTLLGLSSSYAVVSTPTHCVLLSLAFSILHIAFSYTALLQVQMNNLNIQRTWLSLIPAMMPSTDGSKGLNLDLVATPAEVSKWERILHFGKWGGRDGVACLVAPRSFIQHTRTLAEQPWKYALSPVHKLNSSLHVNVSVEHHLNPDELQQSLKLCNEFGDQHLITVKPIPTKNNAFEIYLWFLKPATDAQVIEGFLHAGLVAKRLNRLGGDGGGEEEEGSSGVEDASDAVRSVRKAMHQQQAGKWFVQRLEQQGWDVKHVVVEAKHDSRLEIITT
ncbi:hypothetical protein BASA81_009080 [Batrachochytrium salamandrivorans]|nr:hypothetical protein BASA81_009080 [Batrachochytrium salamandrivorans]